MAGKSYHIKSLCWVEQDRETKLINHVLRNCRKICLKSIIWILLYSSTLNIEKTDYCVGKKTNQTIVTSSIIFFRKEDSILLSFQVSLFFGIWILEVFEISKFK